MNTIASTATRATTLAANAVALVDTVDIAGSLESLLAPLTLPAPTIAAAANAWSPVLVGTGGNDVFDPGRNAGGTAIMQGGTGNEVFYVHDFNDVVVAEAGGADTVITDFGWGTYTAPANVQTLIYDGTASYAADWIALQGNGLDDTLVANGEGIALIAGSGHDTLVGGAGDDIFVVAAGDAGDTIIGLSDGDVVQLKGFAFATWAALQAAMTQVGGDVVVALGGGQTLTLQGRTIAALDPAEFGFPAAQAVAAATATVAAAPVVSTTTASAATSAILGTTSMFASTAAATTTTTSTTASAGVVADPLLPAGGVAAFALRNNGATALGALPATFTEVFAAGEVPKGSGLAAVIGGQTLAVQIDVLTTNADGSAKMAALTLEEPALAAGATLDGTLVLAAGATAAAVDPLLAAREGYTLSVGLVLHNADGSTTPYTFDAIALLRQALAAGTATIVRQGAEVSELRFTAPIAGSLSLTFDLSVFADGTISANVAFDNDFALGASGGAVTYDATIVQNGTVALQQSAITQAQYTTWNQAVGTAPAAAQVVVDIDALERSGAIPNYDPTVGVSTAVIAAETAKLGGATYGILGSASVTTYMPDTGGRADIGPQPAWNAIWLMTQDPGATAFALAQANAAGSVPWHMVNAATGTFLQVTTTPSLWVDPRATAASGYTALTQAIADPAWTPDAAHQPDLSYVAYLMTGNQVYLDELDAQASWDEAQDWTVYRQGALGLVANGEDQVREQAWSLREVDEAAYANPDGSAMKAYFATLESNDWHWLVSQIPAWTAAEGAAYGYLPGNYGAAVTTMAPWEQDYFASTAVQAAEMGNADALTFLTWESNFLVGRFLASAQGFAPQDGVAYNLTVGSGGGQLQSWAAIEQASAAAGQTNGAGWAQSQGDYAELALQSLAGIITVTQSVAAMQAYGWLLASGAPETNPIVDPQYDIVPRLADGALLTAAKVQISADTTATMLTANAGDALIHAGAGNDTLIAAPGIDLLFAGSGNDTLIGAAGSDYLFAGSGADLFALTASAVEADVITGFKVGIDHVTMLGGGVDVARLIAGATSDAAGDAVLHLSAGHSVTLSGVTIGQLSATLFA